jgi:hypothetical protein
MAGQLTGLHAKFTGDSSSFVKASTLATMALRKQEAEARKAKAAQDALAASGVGLTKEFHKLRMETDNAYAGMVRYQQASKLATQFATANKWSQEQLGAELQRLATHYGVAEAAGLSMNDTVRASRFHTANLAAQFNDIGVMMASGQSPFILAVQQGTQISQVLNSMGGNAKSQFAALGQSFLSIVNPTSLLTIGLIAGTAALVQWGMGAFGASEKAVKLEDALGTVDAGLTSYVRYVETAKTRTSELAKEFGNFAAAIKGFSAYAADLSLVQAQDDMAAAIGPLKGQLVEVDGLLNMIAETNARIAAYSDAEASARLEATVRLMEYQERLGLVVSTMGLTVNQATELSSRMAALANLDLTPDELVAAIADVLDYMKQIAPTAAELPPELRKAYFEMENLLRKAQQAAIAEKDLANSAPKGGWMSAAIAETNLLIGRLIAAKAASDAVRNASAGPDFERKGKMKDDAAGNPDVMTIDDYIAAGASNGGGGGGGGEDPLIKELESLQNELASKEQLELESFERRQEVLQQALEKKLITQQEYANLMEQVEATHNFAMLQSTRDGVSASLSALGQLFQGSKKIGAGIALANSWLAFTEVLKDPSYVGRPWARFAAATSALASGLNAVRNIKSASPGGGGSSSAGGGTGSGSAGGGQSYSQQVALQLVGGDMFSRDQVLKLINAINEASKDGARITVR